jgi:hypothetical protein
MAALRGNQRGLSFPDQERCPPCRSTRLNLRPSQITYWGFRILLVVLELLLLAAAGLKFHGLVFDPLTQDSFLASPRLRIAAIERAVHPDLCDVAPRKDVA